MDTMLRLLTSASRIRVGPKKRSEKFSGRQVVSSDASSNTTGASLITLAAVKPSAIAAE